MKDFLGNELQVGDSVVAVRLGYRELVRCTIVALTVYKVRLRLDGEKYFHDTFLQTPDQIILIPR